MGAKTDDDKSQRITKTKIKARVKKSEREKEKKNKFGKGRENIGRSACARRGA